MKLGFDQTSLTNVVILGIPVVSILTAFGLAVSYFRRYRKSPTMLILGYVSVVVISFAIGGLFGLSRMRTENLAFAYDIECQTKLVYKGKMTIDVMQESIAESTPKRVWLIQADETKDMCEDIQNDLENLRKVPHIFVTDGFNRLISVREYPTQ